MEIINGKLIAEQECLAIKKEITEFYNKNKIRPHLVAILVGNDPASETYVKNKGKKCEEVGIESTILRFAENTNENIIIETINQLNNDKKVHAILIQLPLPKHLNTDKIVNCITPSKDVDCLTNENLGKLISGKSSFAPCTASGIIKILEYENVQIEGKHAVVIGRSLLVGKSTATLLTNKNATVTQCHSKTNNLYQYINQADILVVAIGKPKYITDVKENSVVIDVGINRQENGLCGDVDFDKVANKCNKITPVPRGVGPLTIAMLMRNTLTCAEIQQGQKD